ncbi:DUF1761 domain-containing protein [Micromonospora sp. DT81.3]|uniref:DUF1761 domain-containing protein n=1 Tax=Actinomycetes TaxID=1760 RepID=UPI003CE853F5
MWAVGLAISAVVAFILSSAYYALAPRRVRAGPNDQSVPAGSADAGSADERTRPWQIAVEFVRSALVAGLMTGLLLAADWSGPAAGALLGLALWVLPLVLLAGSVVWEKVPVRSALLHAGDWLLKLVAIGAIVGLFV